ncbi:hypothetical protein L7F22_006856 [Adiantum nelumboides]|nr:hypothetical protein [Adiantum nelumboides]
MCAYWEKSLDVRQDMVVVEVPKFGNEVPSTAIKEWGQPKCGLGKLSLVSIETAYNKLTVSIPNELSWQANLSLDKSKYRVAWAVVAENSVTQLGAHKQGLSNKISRVMPHMTEEKTLCKSVLIAQSSNASVDTSNSWDVELAQIMRSDVQAKVRQLESEIGKISKEM